MNQLNEKRLQQELEEQRSRRLEEELEGMRHQVEALEMSRQQALNSLENLVRYIAWFSVKLGYRVLIRDLTIAKSWFIEK